MTFQIARARDYYARAFALLPPADRKSQRPGLVMAAIYRTLLDEIEASGGQVLNQRISLTPLRKLWIAWRTWVSVRREERVRQRSAPDPASRLRRSRPPRSLRSLPHASLAKHA